jgi:hypothetical protein
MQFLLERTEPHEFRAHSKIESETTVSVNVESLADELSKLAEKLSEAERG